MPLRTSGCCCVKCGNGTFALCLTGKDAQITIAGVANAFCVFCSFENDTFVIPSASLSAPSTCCWYYVPSLGDGLLGSCYGFSNPPQVGIVVVPSDGDANGARIYVSTDYFSAFGGHAHNYLVWGLEGDLANKALSSLCQGKEIDLPFIGEYQRGTSLPVINCAYLVGTDFGSPTSLCDGSASTCKLKLI